MMRALICTMVLCVGSTGWAQSAKVESPNVRLVDGGTGQKRVLRYQPKAGQSDRMELHLEAKSTVSSGGRTMPGMPVPTVVFGFDVSVTKVHGNGDFDTMLTVVDTNVSSVAGGRGNMDKVFRSWFGSLRGTTLKTRTTAQGNVVKVTLEAPRMAAKETADTLETLKQTAQDMVQTFPKEAVAVGAKWVVTQASEQNGIKVTLVSETELLAIDKDVIKLRSVLTQSAKPQSIDLNGTEGNLTALKGTGESQMTLNLKSKVPESFMAKGKSHVEMTLGGRAFVADTEAKTNITKQ